MARGTPAAMSRCMANENNESNVGAVAWQAFERLGAARHAVVRVAQEVAADPSKENLAALKAVLKAEEDARKAFCAVAKRTGP